MGFISTDNGYGIISNCYSTANVNGTGWYIGGLVGYNSWVVCMEWCFPGYIFNSYSTGNVNGGRSVGGLVGFNDYGDVGDCYSTSDVNGFANVGGLVGVNLDTISTCYSTGDVNGDEDVGGLVGCNGVGAGRFPTPGYIYNSYAIGSVQGTSHVGGLVGINDFGDIEGSFWDVQTSGEPNMCGSQNELYATGCDPNCGKTTAEMQTRSTFTDVGWDFDEIWLINEGATYPVLRQEIRSNLNGDGGVDLLDFAIFADHWLEGTAD